MLAVRVPREQTDDARRALAPLNPDDEVAQSGGGTLTLAAPDGGEFVVRVAQWLQQAGVVLDEISLRRPTLDDVFLSLTGRPAPDDPDDPRDPSDEEAA